ncbi:MAG: leucine-rich repeat protein [Clostridia bacterium]|nr:leucine-rich repeat protein [Clostridia bacterium]
MKKIICAVLCSLIAFGASANIVFAVTNENTDNNLTAEEFACQIGGLLMSVEESEKLPGKANYDCNNDCVEFETARLIVKSRSKIDTLNAESVINGYDGLWILQFENSYEAAKAYDYYSTRAGIDFVEPDKPIKSTDPINAEENPLSVNETNGYLSWGPEHIGIDRFNKDILENAAVISDTVIAVVDTGVDSDHPFLAGRIVPTKINTSASGIRYSSEDDHGHGTRIAGIIADSTLDNVYIKPYKVMDEWGNGTVITVAAGINCAVKDDVDVINVSIGFEEDSETLKNAIRNAQENDIVVVGAAGNDASDTIYYPASYSSVIKVTAINEENVFANFSSYGNGVDIAAPGVDIITTDMGGGFVNVKGTSFAAPFVAAAAAAITSVEPHASAEDVALIIVASAVEMNEFEAEEKFGNGILFMPESASELMYIEKAKTPYFSHVPAYYTENINLEIFCDEPDSVIYYTTDRTVPSKYNPSAKIYDGTPVTLSETTILLAVAYSENKYRSSVANFSAFIIPYADENELTVDESGTLLSYSGSATNITIPETINGIKIEKIGEEAFAESNITEIVFFDGVTEIGNSAFLNCENLRTISAYNASKIGENALYGCINLRNIYLGELSEIGKYAFYNSGKNQYTVEERSFSLNLEKLTAIPEGAFMGSSISSAELGYVDKIEKNAFADCNALVSVNAKGISNLSNGVFRGCLSLSDVHIINMSYIPAGTFSTCINLLRVNLPDVTIVNSNAFENCISLGTITLEKAETVFSNAFSGCSSLRAIILPSMTGFENKYNQNLVIIPSFPSSLETFSAPKLEKTVSNMFFNSKNIKSIYLDSVKEIAPSTFNECHSIFFLDISRIESVSANAFNNCTIEFIDARNLQTTADMPDNSGILLSNNFIESSDSAVNLTVYGTPKTFVERYARYKGYGFVPIPLIYNEIPEFITENSETIYIRAVGFDLTYQWYSNTAESTEGGTPIKGATTSSYTFTEADKAPYYYCIMTQRDMESVSTIATHIITKDTTPADYTEYNDAVKKANELNRSIYENIFILDSALNVDVSGRYSCEQDIVDRQTQSILDAISNLKMKSVKSVSLYATETELGIFEASKIIVLPNPDDVSYESMELYSDNQNVILVSQNGFVRCIGDGTATVHAKITNTDGSIIEGEITFCCEHMLWEKIIGNTLRPIFLLAYWIETAN